MRAQAEFTITTWEELASDERDGVTIARNHVAKTFTGDIEGESTAELLMATTSQDGSAAYVGFERMTVRMHGRTGTFLLRHAATMARGAPTAEWAIVPDSGTGDLAGISGSGTIAQDAAGGHTFTLEYEVA